MRVILASRWSSVHVLGVRGTPFCFRPSGDADTAPLVEEQTSPHTNADDPVGEGSLPEPQVTEQDVSKIDLRITNADLRRFGHTDNCPKCQDLEAGLMKTKKVHNDECRLRMYLAYREANHPKWQHVRHLIEGSDEDTKFFKGQVDAEHSATIPKADHGLEFYEPQPQPMEPDADTAIWNVGDDRDPEIVQAEDAMAVSLDQEIPVYHGAK